MNNPENPELKIEKAKIVEDREDKLIQGAEILENPPDDSFIHGLQIFIAWVKSLVDDGK